jgi:protein ImuB
MLWLALRLPRLAVEHTPRRAPAVAVENGRIVATDLAAETRGVRTGMRLSSALGLAPDLSAFERDATRELAELERLACWAGGFTPQVSTAPPDELLLEIGGCLRLFGGLRALCKAVRDGAEAQGFSLAMGLAPTPRAARCFARLGRELEGCGERSLRERLSVLPVTVLDLEPRQGERLAVLGIRHIGQLLELPRAGLARRFGPGLPRQLAHALGEEPEPQRFYAFPERFEQRLELPAKMDKAEMLLFGAKRLVLALAGWLAARSAGISECVLALLHEDVEPTLLRLGFATPTRDADRLLRVLRERLERQSLAEPVVELRLLADAPRLLVGRTAGLFGEAAGESLAPVVERLRARLGAAAVHGLEAVAAHRPECTSVAGAWPPARKTDTAVPAGPRPLWLLSRPRALPERDGYPHYGGPLQRLTRAERIESGWWDEGEGGDAAADESRRDADAKQPGAKSRQDAAADDEALCVGDVRRDYFIAHAPSGEWLWIYRDATGWWWHGVFA